MIELIYDRGVIYMNKVVNNKGFTLVELLAVLVMLVSISLVAVGGISASLERRDEKELKEQQELAIGAAKIYFSLNNVQCVKIQTLIDKAYFSSDDKVDRLKPEYTIKLNGNEYSYSNSSC